MKQLFLMSAVMGAVCLGGGADAKNLTVYFSVSGNTERVANAIHDVAGGDIVKINPVNSYPVDDYHNQEFTDLAQREKNENARPEIQDMNINMDEYDTVFIGYPIWWGAMPMAVYTFFDKYDLSGKTVAPFNTHEGSGAGDSHSEIARLEPNANVVDGLTVRGGDTTNDLNDTVKSWLNREGK